MKRKEIINLYKKVQKIPYYCLKERDPDLLLKKNKGSCSEKHLFLGKEFGKLGIPVKYLLIKFDWNDLPIPREIIAKKEDGSVGWHLALKIKPKYMRPPKIGRFSEKSGTSRGDFSRICENKLEQSRRDDDAWIYVDATWDPKLEKAGFPVAKNWDGKSNTKFAVPPKEIIELKKAPPKHAKRPENRKFFDALNKWLELQRKK